MQDSDKTREALIEEIEELRRQLRQPQSDLAEARLAADVDRLASFPEQNPNPVIEIDLNGRVTFQNPKSRERFPDLARQGLAHPILQGLAEAISDPVQWKDPPIQEIALNDRVYERKTIFLETNRLIRVFAYDITEFRRAQTSLSRLASFPEQNPNPVIETDLTGQATYLNPAARERFPDLESEGLGHPVLQGIQQTIEVLREGGRDSVQRDLSFGNRIYHQRTTYLDENSLVRIFCNDVTELKELQGKLQKSLDELEQTHRNLEDAQTQLVENEKMAALGGLVAGIAHEINTPVGVSVTAASHLSSKVESFRIALESGQIKKTELEAFLETAVESSKLIQSNLDRAAEIISSFKQVAVDQSNEGQRKFEVGAYLDEIVLSLRPAIKKTRVDVVVESIEPVFLDSFPGALSQIITNFVMNSFLHAYDEKDSGTIRITVTESEEWCVVTYSDDGKGISSDLVSKVFDPFFTTKRSEGGSGLGLHIVYNLVTHKLGGMLEVESAEGRGTSFTISLPLEQEKGK